VSNLLKPAFLIGLLTAIRMVERSRDSEGRAPTFEMWRRPRVQAAGFLTCCVAAGFGVGFGIGLPAIGTVFGILVGAGVVVFTISHTSNDGLIHRSS
jgi:hypothetical protein